MGGIPTVAPPKPTDAEITARLIEIGRNAKLPDPHTVWVVENPSLIGKFYKDRSELDNICYAMPVSHFEHYPFTMHHLVSASVAFYHYKNRDAAVEDALSRLAKIGRSNDEAQECQATQENDSSTEDCQSSCP